MSISSVSGLSSAYQAWSQALANQQAQGTQSNPPPPQGPPPDSAQGASSVQGAHHHHHHHGTSGASSTDPSSILNDAANVTGASTDSSTTLGSLLSVSA
jgi:hypothetical protein